MRTNGRTDMTKLTIAFPIICTIQLHLKLVHTYVHTKTILLTVSVSERALRAGVHKPLTPVQMGD